ncbi:MAG: sigma 54-interacting transcriptional regulator, partial [Calditrichota bacterium]
LRSHSVVMQKIRSIACVPLEIKGTLIGAIYIDSRNQKARFTQKSLDFLAAFANQAGIAIENARLLESLRQENEVLKEEVNRIYAFKELVGSSKAMLPVFDMIKKVVDNSTTVLIVGETGTGKELIARAVHYNGIRKDKPFIPVNCAALPENLLESELYGYKKGAFTGANADKKGLIEVADTGTLFLDEIAEIPMSLQAKLLRFLQEKEIMPIGGAAPKKVNVRIIAATNRNLADEVREGRFREDLYYRLSIIPINLPPLRERKSDIPLLAEHFLKKFATDTGKRINGFEEEVMGSLKSYGWPGNVRELENAIERAVVLASDNKIKESDVIVRGLEQQNRIESGMTLDDVSRILLTKTLRSCEGNKTRASEMMGVSLRWVHYKTKEWGIQD